MRYQSPTPLGHSLVIIMICIPATYQKIFTRRMRRQGTLCTLGGSKSWKIQSIYKIRTYTPRLDLGKDEQPEGWPKSISGPLFSTENAENFEK